MNVDKIRNELEGFDWTQEKERFSGLTHSIHKYPAKLIPQIPELFISKFGKKGKCILDPYCGSGTTLLEAKKAGFDSIGFDLNPLALLISDMKTRSIKINQTQKEINQFKKKNFDWKKENYSLDFPLEEAMKYFPEKTIWQINHYVNLIEEIRISENTKDILRLAISDILRPVSFTRLGDFKIYMIPFEERGSFYLNPEPLFLKKIDQILEKMKKLRRETYRKVPMAEVTVINHDSSSKKTLPSNITGLNNINLVITSPPYGDSRTTVAYGEFSWFSNRILRIASKIRQGDLDKKLMGGKKRSYPRILDLGSMNLILKKINKKRRKEVKNFFLEYQRSIRNVSEMLNPEGICCYVVGNRNVDGQTIPMDEFTRLCFEHYGLLHVDTYVRDIIGKTLARRNKNTELMNEEIIVVMYKPSNFDRI